MNAQLIDIPVSTTPGPTQRQQTHIRIITDLSDFDAIQTKWDAFMQQAPVQNLCMTHAWLSTWLRHFTPEQLLVIIIEDEAENWLAVAPFQIQRSPSGLTHRLLKHLQFIGTSPTVFDWMKIAIAPVANETQIIERIAGILKKTRWDVLDLQFCSDSTQIATLCQKLGADCKQALTQSTSIPYVNLPATEADYAKNRRKKTRLEVNRHCNRFAKEYPDPLEMTFLPTGENTQNLLDHFCKGHIDYWANRGHNSDFHRFPNLTQFYKDMLTLAETTTDPHQPKLLFSVLQLGEQNLSYQLGFWQGNSYLSHITHFNQNFRSYSPGTIHMDALVFDTIRRNGIAFEFGRGDEPYKKMWAQDKKPLWNLRIFKSPLSKTLWQADVLLKKLLRKDPE